MSDIKSASVVIKFTTVKGTRLEYKFEGAPGKLADADVALLSAIDELARILAVDNRQDDALARVNDAVKRVSEWRAKP
jgi:hypothetical protein